VKEAQRPLGAPELCIAWSLDDVLWHGDGV